jgi:chemotaxis protein CheY-P-specific phosphatase CheC
MNLLSEFETSIAREILNIGLAKAGDALSFFLKEKILISSLDISFNHVNEIKSCVDHESKEVTVLTTQLIGEMPGVCYLIFSKTDKEKLLRSNLPESIFNDQQKKISMTEGFMLETDNIVAASVITQFSNLFKLKIYGGVPSYSDTYCDDFVKDVLNKYPKDQLVVNFKAEFNTEAQNFNPVFLWILDGKFIHSIKEFAKDEANLGKIRSN